jgi:hypothetical protein
MIGVYEQTEIVLHRQRQFVLPALIDIMGFWENFNCKKCFIEYNDVQVSIIHRVLRVYI